MRCVDEIRTLFRAAALNDVDALISEFADDSRAGVQALIRSARNRLAADQNEHQRVLRMMELQLRLHAEGLSLVAGVDEVGRGALAGPVTAAAAVLDASVHIPGLDDSKRLTPANREIVAARVREAAIALCVAHVPSERIDALGISAANTLAMRTALDGIRPAVDHVIADGLAVDLGRPSTFVVGGDRVCACVAAASVVAKVERDALMRALAIEHPDYDFQINKGYGTPEHLEAIARLGSSPVHRKSFSPCSQDRLF
jgi:ribonuclease HII